MSVLCNFFMQDIDIEQRRLTHSEHNMRVVQFRPAKEFGMADLIYFAGGAALFALMLVYAVWLNEV
jgi:hypothetical protein